MKKIFTLMAAAAASMSMWGADAQLYFGDKPVQNGATYEVGYTLNEVDDELMGKIYEVTQDSHLYFHADPGTEVALVVELLSTGVTGLQVCSVDGECTMLPTAQGGMTVTKSGPLKEAVSSAMIDKKSEGYGEMPELQQIDVKVTCTFAGQDPVNVIVKMLASPQSGLKSAALGSDFVKAAAGNVLNYSVSSPRTLSLYAITGNLVAKYQLESAGSVNISALPKGIYIYTDGTHNGKVVVR